MINCVVKFNKEDNEIELYFYTKMSNEINNKLKLNGFKWNSKRFWAIKNTKENIEFIEENFNVKYEKGNSFSCKICERKVSGIDSDRLKNGMCRKHYNQFIIHNKTFDENKNTKNDKNEIIKYSDYANIILYDIYGNEKDRAIVDIEDIEKVKEYKWHLANSGYVMSADNKVLLNRLIMNCNDDNLVVDHIDRKPLDNRKCNLRICNHSDNSKNKKTQSNNTSNVTGVSWHKNTNKWRVRIQVDRKNINIGSFIYFEEAVKARQDAEIKYFGEYRPKK